MNIKLLAYEPPNEPNCCRCPSFKRCLPAVFENLKIRCLHYGWLRTQVNESVDKLNSIKEVYLNLKG